MSRWIGVGSFLGCLGLLGSFAMSGDGGARAGGIAGLTGVLLGLAFPLRALVTEHGDELQPPGRLRLLGSLLEASRWIWAGLLVVYVSITLASGGSSHRAVTAVGLVGAGAAFMVALGRQFRCVLGREGVERETALKGIAWSFFLTMTGALVYGLLEVTVDAPHLSMWAVWALGGLSLAGSSVLLGRRS